MSESAARTTTQRPYDLELREYRSALYATHVALNRAAAVALDWLLTVRGGLSAELALRADALDADAVTMLTRCWFVPEVGGNAPVTTPEPTRLESILVADGLSSAQRQRWHEIADSLLEAPIRKEARWVDRRAVYEQRRDVLRLSDEAINDILFESGLFTSETFLSLAPNVTGTLSHAMRGYLSRRLGSGTGADFPRLARLYDRIAQAAADQNATLTSIASQVADDIDGLFDSLRMVGHRSRTLMTLKAWREGTMSPERRATLAEDAANDARSCRKKIPKLTMPWTDALAHELERASGLPWRGERDHLAEYSVILDLAARRFSAHHSWIKRNEALRIERRANTVAARVEIAAISQDALDLLDRICAERKIDQRSTSAWKLVHEAWTACSATTERVEAVRTLQAERRGEFGDPALFEQLALDNAACVRDHPETLELYAKIDRREPLAVAVKHIDPHRSPAWVEYGKSRLTIRCADEYLELETVAGGSISTIRTRARSTRLRDDLLAAPREETPTAPRADSLGRLRAGANLSVPRVTIDNGRLYVPHDALARLANIKDDAARYDAAARLPWRLTFSAELPVPPIDARLITALRAMKGTKGPRRTRRHFSGIPHLRILGVDLGLRAGAACAIVETLTNDDVRTLCSKANVVPPQPHQSALVFKGADGERVALRRIAADDAPAPWARIEQTWTVRLPGEGRDAVRRSTDREIAHADAIGRRLMETIYAGTSTLDLRRSCTKAVLAAVRRNNRLARTIANLEVVAPDASGRAPEWLRLQGIQRLTHTARRAHPWLDDERAIARRTVGELDDAAAALLADDAAVCASLAQRLRTVWAQRDDVLRACLRELRQMTREQHAEARRQGGLSLKRLEAIDGYYRLLRAWACRPHPDEPSGRPAPPLYAKRIGDLRRRLATERVRLLANRIVSAALGGPRWPGDTTRHVPCSAIVTEDLADLRTNLSRPRARNRQIAVLAPATIAKMFDDVCELAGVLHYTVPPEYTSRRNAVTGAPGCFIREVPLDELLFGSRWEHAANRRGPIARLIRTYQRHYDAERATWTDAKHRTWYWNGTRWHGPGQGPPSAMVPVELGPRFLGVDGRCFDADTNAAANIALLPLVDPAWEGAWWSVPVGENGRTDPIARTAGAPDVQLPTGRRTQAWHLDDSWVCTADYWQAVEERVCALIARCAALPWK